MIIFEILQNHLQMIHMFFLIPRVNADIINTDDNEQVQVLFEHSVY